VNVYPFIEAEKSKRRNVKRACVLLKVSRSAFYADRTAGASQRERDDADLTEAIIAVHDESDGTCGSPRVHAELAERGRRHSRKRVARLMRAAGRRGRAPKRRRCTCRKITSLQVTALSGSSRRRCLTSGCLVAHRCW
jgi:hypothetical protein